MLTRSSPTSDERKSANRNQRRLLLLNASTLLQPAVGKKGAQSDLGELPRSSSEARCAGSANALPHPDQCQEWCSASQRLSLADSCGAATFRLVLGEPRQRHLAVLRLRCPGQRD